MRKSLNGIIAGLLCVWGSSLAASPLFTSGTIGGETDTLSITLVPSGGALDGPAGSVVGWGFDISWSATNNYISFTGSSLGSVASGETNGSFLDEYTDFVGSNSGPDGIALGDGTWAQSFDGSLQTGVGAYGISSDPSLAVPLAEDTAQLTFNFDIYSGYPTDNGVTDLGSFSYYGTSTQFSVTVDQIVSETPEPGTFCLLGAAFVIGGFYRRRSIRNAA